MNLSKPNYFCRALIGLTAASFCVAVSLGQENALFEGGLTLHKKNTSTARMGRGGQNTSSTMYCSGSSIREISSDGEEFVIYYKEGRFVTIDHNRKTYSDITFDELEDKLNEVSGKIREKSAQDKQAMEMLKKMMGSGQMGEASLENLGPGEDIAGFSTIKYRILMSPLQMTVWAAPDLPVPDVYYDTMKIQAKPNPVFDMEKMFDVFKQIEGMSLKTVVLMEMMGMKTESTNEVTKVEKGPVPEPVIPAGYVKKEIAF